MAKYFIFGNVWLLMALVLLLFRQHARSEPYMVSFTEFGAWLYPETYNLIVGGVLIVAAACFTLTVLAAWRKVV